MTEGVKKQERELEEINKEKDKVHPNKKER